MGIRVGSKVVLKRRREKDGDWVSAYNGMKCKIIDKRTTWAAECSCGDKHRIYRLEYERFVGSIRNGGFTGWFSAKEFKAIKDKTLMRK